MRQIPIELRHFPMDPSRNMRPPMPQEQRQEPHQIPIMYQQPDQNLEMYGQEQQGAAMMPPPPPPPSHTEQQIPEQRVLPQMIVPQTEQRMPMQPQIVPERPHSPFQGIPIEIRRIIQQVPLEIKNIIQHITGEARPVPIQVSEGARREVNSTHSLK